MKITFRRVVNGVTIDGGKSVSIDFIQRGRTGDRGEQGLQGIVGEKGEQGEQGECGLQGIQGIQGERGVAGTQGIKGDKGDCGVQGMQGIQGVKGDKGDKGEGLDWSTMTPEERLLLHGEKGERGEQGEQGIQGIQGIQGYKGDAGSQGLRGYSGSTGATGAIGAKGEKGDIGATGIFDPTAIISSLATINKTVPGAINELNSGKAKTDLSDVVLSKSMSSNGYYKAPDGLLIQWGVANGGKVTVYFPTTFRSVFSFTATPYYKSADNALTSTMWTYLSTSSASIKTVWMDVGGSGWTTEIAEKVYWIAVGSWK